MRVFYHGDNDGKCAAHLVAEYTGDSDPDNYIEMSYEKEFPLDIIQPNEEVWIVDFSIAPEKMKQLLEITNNVVWIDHHITAIDQYKELQKETYISGIRVDGISGCELTWLFINGIREDNVEDMKRIIKDHCEYYIRLIGDRDVWKWEYKNDTKYFHSYTETIDLSPLSKEWKIISNYFDTEWFLDDIMQIGKAVEQYKINKAKEELNRFGYFKEWEGYNCFFINKPINSEEVDYIEEDWDVYVAYIFTGAIWKVSLRSAKDIDVSVIAKKFCGGGHFHSAGFEIKELPWKN